MTPQTREQRIAANFKIVKKHMNCWKVYFGNVMIGAWSSERRAQNKIAQITSKLAASLQDSTPLPINVDLVELARTFLKRRNRGVANADDLADFAQAVGRRCAENVELRRRDSTPVAAPAFEVPETNCKHGKNLELESCIACFGRGNTAARRDSATAAPAPDWPKIGELLKELHAKGYTSLREVFEDIDRDQNRSTEKDRDDVPLFRRRGRFA
jgi:hypothetical protein